MSATRLSEQLAIRLAAAFVLVAVTAVLVLAGLTVLSARREVSALVERQHRTDTEAGAAAAGQAYEIAGGWDGAQLSPAGAIAVRSGAALRVSTPDGRIVGVPTAAMGPMHARMHGGSATAAPDGEVVSAPIVVEGRRVGDVTLTFPAGDLPAAEREVRDAWPAPPSSARPWRVRWLW